jgi:hypothetical protein
MKTGIVIRGHIIGKVCKINTFDVKYLVNEMKKVHASVLHIYGRIYFYLALVYIVINIYGLFLCTKSVRNIFRSYKYLESCVWDAQKYTYIFVQSVHYFCHINQNKNVVVTLIQTQQYYILWKFVWRFSNCFLHTDWSNLIDNSQDY